MRDLSVIAIIILIVCFFTISAFAQDDEESEVRYTCDTNIGAIEIHLSNYDTIFEGDRSKWEGNPVPWEQAQKIETIRGAGSIEHYIRKAGKSLQYECVLQSGKYVISFGAHWLNANVEGADGMDVWPTVKITRGKETIMPNTILGKCDIGRSGLGSCQKEWAVRVFLFHSGNKPCVTMDRYTKDWLL